jgi:hypothetical protein
MPVMRFDRKEICRNLSLPAGGTTNFFAVGNYQFVAIYVRVTSATKIELEVLTHEDFKKLDELNFSAADHGWFIFLACPFDVMRLKTTAATTLSAELHWKT